MKKLKHFRSLRGISERPQKSEQMGLGLHMKMLKKKRIYTETPAIWENKGELLLMLNSDGSVVSLLCVQKMA